jgi:hypothetical protein
VPIVPVGPSGRGPVVGPREIDPAGEYGAGNRTRGWVRIGGMDSPGAGEESKPEVGSLGPAVGAESVVVVGLPEVVPGVGMERPE